MSVTATGPRRMSATDLAEAKGSRQASGQEVIEAHLPQIEAVSPLSTPSRSSWSVVSRFTKP